MRFPDSIIKGKFIERLNRFSALVSIKGQDARAYLPNSGRLKELLIKGVTVYLNPAASGARYTLYDLILAESAKTLVSVDSRVPNRLLEECFRAGSLPGFEKYRLVKKEVGYGSRRLDFLLRCKRNLCYIEAKSVTLNRGGIAFFPDAPTERGRHHLEALIELRRKGHQAGIIFVAQREDSLSFSPNDDTDPAFGRALREAISSGVEAHAYRCELTLKDIKILDKIPVRI